MNVVAFVSDPEKEWNPLEGKMVEERSHDDIQYLRKSVFDLYGQKALPLYYAQARRPNANLK